MDTAVEVAVAHDMSAWGLFMQADWVVKGVMIGLLLASIACWSVIFSKLAAYARARREMRAFDRLFASGESLPNIYARVRDGKSEGLGALFAAAMDEWNGSHAANAANPAGLQVRLRMVLDSAIAAETARLDSRLSLLATVGSAAPFIGLFGTVWGIMNAFTAIAVAESTSLSVVAPGIAEALFATALGLLAAIPAVIAYNKLSSDSGKLIARLEAFADRVAVLLSRQLDAQGHA